MSILAATQAIIDWGRLYIPDPKTRTKAVVNEEVGRTSLPSTQRETFYIKHQANGSVSLYVDPYLYTNVSTFASVATYSKVFLFNATLQSCTFALGSEAPMRPPQFKPVLSTYEYTEKLPYCYSDLELLAFLPAAISYLNNTYSVSYAYTGTTSTFSVTLTGDNEKSIVAMALAVIVRRSYVTEQMRRGLGVSFRGPMAAISSREQLLQYNKDTEVLEKNLSTAIYDLNHPLTNVGQIVNIYDENVVTI